MVIFQITVAILSKDAKLIILGISLIGKAGLSKSHEYRFDPYIPSQTQETCGENPIRSMRPVVWNPYVIGKRVKDTCVINNIIRHYQHNISLLREPESTVRFRARRVGWVVKWYHAV